MHLKNYMRCRMTEERKFLENLSIHFAKMYMRFLCNMQNFLRVFVIAFNRQIFLRVKRHFCVFLRVYLRTNSTNSNMLSVAWGFFKKNCNMNNCHKQFIFVYIPSQIFISGKFSDNFFWNKVRNCFF